MKLNKTWKMPLLLAVIILFGLLSALLGTGGWHLTAWAALVVPVIVLARYMFFKR